MPTLDDVRKKIPELDGLDDQSAVDVLHSVYYPDMGRDLVASALGVKAPAAPSNTNQFTSGFKRSFADLPGLAAGVGAFGADVVGADDTRDKLLAAAKSSNDQEAQDHAGDAASLTDAWDGKSSWMDFLKNSAGYVAGQALQSIATGGVGSIGMRMLVKSGAAKVAEAAAAKAIAAGATEDAAKAVAAKAATDTLKKASIAGAAVGAGGHNFGMELGSIYPAAVDQATKDGTQLDGGDLARVGLSAAAAAGVDTAAEGIMASRILRGSGAGGGLVRRAATEIPTSMAREAGTEAAQTAIEHYGAGQPIADEAGLKDIVDSAGVGAVGGGLGGALASTHAHAHPEAAPVVGPPVAPPPAVAPAEQALAANAPLDAKGFQWTPPAAAAPGLAPTAQPGGMDFEADPRFAGAPTYGTGEAPPAQQVYGTQQAASMAIGEQGLVGTHSAVPIGANAWEIRPDAAPDMKMIAPGIYEAPTPGDALRAQLVPDVGPLSRATNLGLAAGADHMDADAAQAAATTPAPLEPAHESALLDFANQRAQQLETKATGVKEKKTPGPDGKPVITPEVPKQFLTPTEQAEQAFLQEHGGNAQVLATHYSPAEQAVAEPSAASPPPAAAPAAEPHAGPERPTVPGPDGDQRAVFSSEQAANDYLIEARRGRSTPLIASIKPVQREDGTWMLATPAEIEAGKTYTTKLSPKGAPFTHKGQAMAVARKIGGTPEKIEGGWGVRQEVPKTVNEWQGFSAESGSLGVPRADMPQIAAEHRGAMVNFLTARGITHETAEVDPAALKPTQAEFSPAKVLKAREFEGGDRSILISSDNHVLDGHHQWLAKLSTNEPVKVIRLDAPIAKLVAEVHEFPSSTLAEGATDTQTETPNAAGPAERAVEAQAPAAEGQPSAAVAGDVGRARAQRLAAARTAAVEADGLKTPEKKPRSNAATRATAERAAKLADYFAPGNIVKSYGGHDIVLGFTPASGSGNDYKTFSVKVHEVKKNGASWVVDPKARDRTHSTTPDAKELAAGPAQRAEAKPAETKPAAAAEKKSPDEEPLPFSRSKAGEAPSARTSAVESFANQITTNWANAPKVVVVDSMADPRIPAAVRDEDTKQRSQGAAGDPEGFYLNGTVYLVSSQLPGDRDVLRVLMHESLGHFGLRSVFGKELATILDRMAILHQGKVMTKAREYGLDMDKLTDRRAAAEEVLAEMAQTNPQLGWVKRAVAAIRSWLRENVPGFDKMKFTDDELVRNFIEPARGWVKQGEAPSFSRAAEPAPMFSRSLESTLTGPGRSLRDVQLPAGYKVGDLMDTTGKLSWWHKTVGTPFNLAQRSPKFARVYDGVQRFIGDTSYYANEAMNKASDILPKLEDWKDIGRAPLSAEDTKALSRPVFEGTLSWTRGEDGKPVKVADLAKKAESIPLDDKAHELLRRGLIDPNVLRMWQGREKAEYDQMIEQRYQSQALKAGIVFTPPELKSLFGLTDSQVKLYQQTRAAVDNSVTSMAISHMLRLAGDDAKPLADKAMDLADVDKAGELLRDHLFEAAKANPDRADELNDSGNRMIDIADQAKSLMDKGYAPLSRFGQYTLDVVKPDGERAYFGLFESAAERAKMERQMRANYPDAKVLAGTVSQEEYKQFQGVSPETLALFGEMLGLGDDSNDPQQNAAFQEYIKRGISSRSALKRLIERKGIAGFSEDVGRVLAGFIVSNARNTSSNLHMKDIDRATTEVDQNPDGSRTGQGELKDAAIKLVSYIKNPVQEAPAARGLLVTQYLGGNVASAMMNATQPLTTSLPYLSQFAGAGGAAKALLQAAKYANKHLTGDKALDAALKRASEEGIVSPQEIHNLMAQASGRAVLKSGDGTAAGNMAARASNFMSKSLLAWGKVFSVAEQFNRRLTFIAAFKIAQEKGIADPAAFAAKAVHATQFVQNKGNRPQWARGAIGATLFTFRSYSISYIELLHRMATAGEAGSPERAAGRKAALLALGVLFMMGGSDGLPFADDIGDLIDGALQRLGYNVTTKEEKRRFFAGILGEGGAQFLAKGLSGLPGAPIDISGRSSMGNLIPGTGLLTRKPDHTDDLAELLGPAGDFAKRTLNAADNLTRGEVAKAAQLVAPTAIQNVGKAYTMATKGQYEDAKGAKVIDTDAMDAVAKAFGFQPIDVAKVQAAKSEEFRYKGLQTLRTQEIAAKWATGLATSDASLVQEAKDERDDWNAKNPTRITVNMPSLLKAVREMKKTAAQRLEDSSPKGLRQKIRDDLARATQ